jgi:hypothetical protein
VVAELSGKCSFLLLGKEESDHTTNSMVITQEKQRINGAEGSGIGWQMVVTALLYKGVKVGQINLEQLNNMLGDRI